MYTIYIRLKQFRIHYIVGTRSFKYYNNKLYGDTRRIAIMNEITELIYFNDLGMPCHDVLH